MSGFAQYREPAVACAHLFRLGRDVEAALVMVELFGGLMPLFDRTPAALQQQWGAVLGQVLACQEGQDWLGVADYLEYELLELMRQGGES
ncbi:hypothetical protein PMM47T1_26603 [Pseudomonas sp. M47T1]|uniref:hypothetical protein n=1 Tax=unclassified Pseudomonas TaxID=196821 RepID=UPI0002608644|nr:hypothetical protein [Pseudomonas sp. M47T1]EIK93534.1 hypothetical protein PMM47T1_26603 [Pseudomonas sp. M47T1]